MTNSNRSIIRVDSEARGKCRDQAGALRESPESRGKLGMEKMMSKWRKKFGKILTAAGISAFIAVSSLAIPIAASAAKTNTDGVTIRNDASTDAGGIGILDEGAEVTLLEAIDGDDGYVWYYVQLDNGNTGYIRSDLVDASEEELAAIGAGQPQNEQAQEPETEEKKVEEPQQEEPAQEEPDQDMPAGEEKPQEANTAATAPAKTGDGEYDATKDPNAAFRVSYETDENGNGEWYVYNDDNGSKWKVSDLQGQGGAAAGVKGVSGIWRTLAILFGIIAIALAAFVLFLLKSIREGRSKTTRGRALEAAAAGYDDEEEEEEDEYYIEDDEDEIPDEDADEDYEEEELPADEDPESGLKADEKEPEAEESAKKPVRTPDSTITMDPPAEPEITEIPAEEIEAAIAATTAQLEKNISENEAGNDSVPSSEPGPAVSAAKASVDQMSDGTGDPESYDEEPDEVFEDEDYAEEDEGYEDEEPEEDGDYEEDEDYAEDEDSQEDDDYADEDYEDYEEDEDDGSEEDDDYVEEDYEEEDYEDDEEEEDNSRRKSRSSSKGGFFGFLKKMFGTDSKEDAEDEGEDFDDYDDEPEEHEFDEFKEYPEDIDLLPRDNEPVEDQDFDEEEDFSDQDADTAGSERGRLSMQRVMKNVSYKEEEADFSDDDDDLSASLFEDDDDMEYSFISNTRNKK